MYELEKSLFDRQCDPTDKRLQLFLRSKLEAIARDVPGGVAISRELLSDLQRQCEAQIAFWEKAEGTKR